MKIGNFQWRPTSCPTLLSLIFRKPWMAQQKQGVGCMAQPMRMRSLWYYAVLSGPKMNRSNAFHQALFGRSGQHLGLGLGPLVGLNSGPDEKFAKRLWKQALDLQILGTVGCSEHCIWKMMETMETMGTMETMDMDPSIPPSKSQSPW